tara:strand:- start:549 stop:665 length:117 start_codon:yes stop_codon:yes gene_type:complete
LGTLGFGFLGIIPKSFDPIFIKATKAGKKPKTIKIDIR